MSVALIAHYLGPRLGIGQYLDRLLPPLVTELKNRKIDVKIFASPNAIEKTPALQALQNSNTAVISTPPLDYSPGKRYAWVATKFAGFCRENNINAVAWLSNPIVLPWHPPTLAVLHDVNEWKAKSKYGDRLKTTLRALIYLDASLQFAKEIVAVSKATETDILSFRNEGKIKTKLTAISNGSDSKLSGLEAVEISAPKEPFLLSVGRIDPAAKRLPEAVNLAGAIREISGEPYTLQIVGGMNTTTQSAGEAFIKSLENSPWATYHGHVSDAELAQWYRQAKAVVFLSDNEGFGFPIAEAASFNRWGIISCHNQAAIEAGGNAIIAVDPDNPKAGAATVLEKLQEGTAPAVQNLQTWQNAAVGYADIISRLL